MSDEAREKELEMEAVEFYQDLWVKLSVAKAYGAECERRGMEKAAQTERIQKFWNAQAEWSQATFGSDSERDHFGPLKHLAKEAVEAQVRPSDPIEIADCLFLVFDAARRSGMTLDTLIKVAEQKLIVNKARIWNRPTTDEPVEHIREAADIRERGKPE